MDAREASRLLSRKEEKFDAIINTGTAMGYYGEDEDARMFKGLRNIARSHGLLVIETVNRDYLIKHFQNHTMVEREGIVWHESRKLDLDSSFMKNIWKFYRKSRGSLRLVANIPVSHRVYSIHELKNLIQSAGWSYRESYGSLQELAPLTTDSFHMTMVSGKV